jgi:hypothetical protein
MSKKKHDRPFLVSAGREAVEDLTEEFQYSYTFEVLASGNAMATMYYLGILPFSTAVNDDSSFTVKFNTPEKLSDYRTYLLNTTGQLTERE